MASHSIFYVQEQVRKGNWRLEVISKDILGTPRERVVRGLTHEKGKQVFRPVEITERMLGFLNSIVIRCPKCGERIPLRFK